jgi:hypothetical protein
VAQAEFLVNGESVEWVPYPETSDTFVWDCGDLPPEDYSLSVRVLDSVFNEATETVVVRLEPPQAGRLIIY